MSKPTLGLRSRFILLISAVLLVVYGSIAVILVRSTVQRQASDLNRESMAFASLATKPIGDAFELYQNSGTIRVTQQVERFSVLDSNVSNIAVLSATGQRSFSENNSAISHFPESDATSFNTVNHYGASGQIDQIIVPYFADGGAHPFNVLYQISGTELHASLQRTVTIILIFTILGLIATSAAMYFLIDRFFLRPIKEVSRLAGVISLGKYDVPIKLDRHDEIGDLADSVERMADSLEADIAKLQEVDKVKSEFMAISSHNLRTPLSIINAYLEDIATVNDVKALKEAIMRIGDSVRRLDGFAEDVLTISNFELGDEALDRELTDVAEFMGPIAENVEAATQLVELKFTSEINTKAKVMISPPHVRSAVWNLLDNAMKFTAKGGSVNLRVTDDGQMVSIAIEDTGIGISPEEVPKLFTKFHRGTSVMTYDYEGTGIGLYASKLIIDKQEGRIDVKTTVGKGSSFTIKLPVAKAVEEVHNTVQKT